MTTDHATETEANNGAGSDSTQQKRWFRRIKKQLTRENMDRRYYAASDHVWLGMNDIWWALTHPMKSIPRNVGQLTAIVVVASFFGTLGYVFFGEADSARVNLEEPSSLLKVAADKTVRPLWRIVRGVSSSIEVTVDTPDDVEEYDGADYRR